MTKSGKTVSIRGDRSGGNFSSAEVRLGDNLIADIKTPANEYLTEMAALEASDPGLKPYFYLQVDASAASCF